LHGGSFRPTYSEAEYRIPEWVPLLQVELKTERFVMAIIIAAPLSVRSLSKIAHILAHALRTSDFEMILGHAVKSRAVDRAAARAYNAEESFNLERLIAD
jgi:hypothetical protein